MVCLAYFQFFFTRVYIEVELLECRMKKNKQTNSEIAFKPAKDKNGPWNIKGEKALQT